MQRFWTLVVAVLLLTCSWQNTINLLLDAGSCCITVCCDEESNCRDDNMNGRCSVKSCFCCCYLMPVQQKMVLVANNDGFIASFSSPPLSTFINDVFHPPEYM